MSSELIAYCGLYCGACSFRLAARENDRTHIEKMPSFYDKFKNQPLEDCPGCRLENKCGECQIRDCAIDKNIAHCDECTGFPCDIIINFNNDGKPHHGNVLSNLELLKALGEDKWLEYMHKKWSCQQCGSKISWYNKHCNCSD